MVTMAMDGLHHLVVADDLDGHLLVGLRRVTCPHYIAEHAMARVTVHYVTLVKLLPDTHTIVPFRIIPVVSQCWVLVKIT